MKKTYQNPTLEVVKIETAQMLAASKVDMFNDNASGPGLSREFIFEDGEF